MSQKPCYFCGQPGSTTEHLPPKQLFPNGQYDRITVPSCDVHNTQKSNIDDVVIKFLMSIVIDKIKTQKVSRHLMDLIKKNMGHINEHEKKFEQNSVLYPDSLVKGVSFRSLISGEDMFRWAAQIAVGLLSFANKGHDPDFNYSRVLVESNSFDTKGSSKYSPEEFFEKRNHVIDLENAYRKKAWFNGPLKGPRTYPNEVFLWKANLEATKITVWIEMLTYFIWWVQIEAPLSNVNKYRNFLK